MFSLHNNLDIATKDVSFYFKKDKISAMTVTLINNPLVAINDNNKDLTFSIFPYPANGHLIIRLLKDKPTREIRTYKLLSQQYRTLTIFNIETILKGFI